MTYNIQNFYSTKALYFRLLEQTEVCRQLPFFADVRTLSKNFFFTLCNDDINFDVNNT